MTDLPAQPPKSHGSFAVRALLAALVTAACVQFSLHHGRLIFRGPMADDANYFCDGLERLRVFYQSGAMGLLRSLAHDPPHAPFSTLLAMASFMVFGLHAWAPYAGNGIIVLALLTLVDRLLGSVRPWQRGMVYALVLATRLPMTAVVEFRPDIAAGIAAAWGILDAFRSPLLRASNRRRARLGAIFSLAILFKPAMTPIYGLLFIASLVLAMGAEILGERAAAGSASESPPTARSIGVFRAMIPALLMAAILCLPYFAFAWRDAYQYIFVNLLGQRSAIWQFHGTIFEHLRYYYDLPNHGGSFLLGIGYTYLLTGIVLAGIVMTLRREPLARWRLIGLLIVGVLSFAIPACAKMKNPFYGAIFQSLLLLSAVISLRRFLQCGRCAGLGAFIAVCVAGVLLLHPPLYRGDPGLSPTSSTNQLLDQVYATVQTGQIGDRIFIPAPGSTVSWNTLNYLSTVDETHRRFSNLEFSHYDDAAALSDELDQADWVVAGDVGNNEARMDLPNGRYGLAGYLAAAKSRTDFAEVASFPAWTAEHQYHIFRRTTPAFAGFDEATAVGISPPDGPHPHWRLPIIRYVQSNIARLKFTAPATGGVTVVASYYSKEDGTELKLSIDGNPIASATCDQDDAFHDLHARPQLPPGLHELSIECKPAPGRNFDPAQPIVLFKKIQIFLTAK